MELSTTLTPVVFRSFEQLAEYALRAGGGLSISEIHGISPKMAVIVNVGPSRQLWARVDVADDWHIVDFWYSAFRHLPDAGIGPTMELYEASRAGYEWIKIDRLGEQ